ncbi:MAG: homocysteine S-methyltransferase family protein [Lachnospiraceae bacterium]|nr:homocysteine S-methyltransferase family protein [Lachnospiraceae bacterium]
MHKQDWLDYIGKKGGFVVLDGATGSNLMKAGMPVGVCPEKWILEHPQVLIDLQKQYVEAGCDVVYAPTFTTNRIKLKEYGLADKQQEMIQALVGLSKTATQGKALVAGDITMTGEQLAPIGKMNLEELIEVYKEQIQYMMEAGVDLLVVETMMSLAECRAAVIAAKEICELPIMVTLTFEENGRTLFGTDAKTAAIVLESMGAAAIGVNCSTGPAKMAEIVTEMVAVTEIPVIAKPNAGLPQVDEQGNTIYTMSPEEFAEEMSVLVEQGATILGGCCGTTPAHIQALKKMLQDKKPVERVHTEGMRYLTSERQTLAFGLDGNFLIVGERINPTGKKAIQEELRQNNIDRVLSFAEEQEADGASVLDVNMGMSGIDEKAMMLHVIEELQTVTNLPLSLDSSHIDVLEAALRHYPGRALVNSVSYEKEKFEKLLPLVKKYGAMFILLPLSDEGLPKDLEEKKDIIEKIYTRAMELGMKKEDIVVDGLVTTVGANPKAGVETLETIRYCKEKGLATICGLSNISFGMPSRVYVNTAFLTLAIHEGLTMAIANPSQEMLVCGALATDLLMAKQEADLRYIEYASKLAPVESKAKTVAVDTVGKAAGKRDAAGRDRASEGAQSDKASGSNDEQQSAYVLKLKEAVLKGNRSGIVKLTKEALAAGEDAQVLLNEALLPAINLVGDYFEQKKYFLPQLIAGAEAMKLSIEVLEEKLLSSVKQDNMPVVVIATVEGDIHDIGKNLVALMLKNYGFEVVDLGKDVPKETIIQAAKEHNADIIALSALMTTTMQRMRDVVELVKAEGLTTKVMIGGAVTTPEYAVEISADGYSKDAAEAVKVAKRLLGMLNS